MIEAELQRDSGILTIEPRGRLEEADLERLRLLVDPWIAEHGRLPGVLIFSESFEGWDDFGTFIQQLRFVNDEQRRVERVAVLGNGAMLSLVPKLGDWFVEADVRSFDFADRDRAEAWLRGERPG
jgi:hypothetical protein